MSHQSTTTDFDKFTTFKITTGQTVKRTSNESHDDESKKLKLEKSGSVVLTNTAGAGVAINPSVTTQQTNTHLITSNNAVTAAAAAAIEMQQHSKKLKSTRMKLNETSASSTAATTTLTASSSAAAGYSLIVEDATATTGTGTISEESSESVQGKTFTTTTTSGEEQVMFIRKHITNKGETVTGNLNNESCLEERIIHIEGDPSGNAAASYITAMSTKPPPKRLQIGMAEAKKSLGDSIDLKLITTTEGQGANKISMVTADKKPEQILISASNTTINPQNTFTYSRVCSVTGQQGEQGAVNIKSLQGAVNKQSLMVSSKKLLPEVTQTTAKVSIGNTTISVPLLKPLSSTQIIQTGSGNTGQGNTVEGAKGVIHTIQAGGSTASQTQLSKILNIKRGQKGAQPTYVSFSQLQIKPVNSIVQAKVVSKKIPVQIQAVQTNKTTLLQQTSGVVTITSSKPDPHNLHQQQATTIQGHILPSPQKKQQLSFVKEIPAGAIIKTTSTANIEEANSSSSNISNSSSGEQGSNKVSGESTIKLLEKSGQLIKTNTAGDTSANSTIVKVVHTTGPQQHTLNASNIRTTLTTQMDNAEHSNTQQQQQQQQSQQTQQQRINICPTISIVRQNSPQLVTTSGNVSTVSLSMADAVSGQQKQLILTKSQFANVSAASVSGSMGNTMTTNFPRNISLMLAKSSASQQVFTTSGGKNTLCVTTAAGNNKLAGGGTRLNLNKQQPNVVNTQVTTVAASNQNDADSTSVTTGVTDSSASNETGSTNVQQQQQQTSTITTQNRKIIQVLPGIYSSSDGSYVKITKKAPQEDDDKKKDQQQQTQQIQQQQQHIHLQIQQQQQQQNTTQQQQNHITQQQQQIHMQIQPQQQQQQNHTQQIHIQQIQNAQQQRQQQLQQHRQQLLHKQQMQQIQKQQQQHQMILNQQQQQQQSQDTTTTAADNNTTETTITTTSNQLTNSNQTTTTTKFSLNQNLSSTSSTSQYIHSNTNTTTTNSSNEHQQQQQQTINLPKPEESNNVLLKQLLQNSNTTPSNQNNSSRTVGVSSSSVSSTAATTVLPARKVINVRAPSLGLVSSLEAQLARPVIPPVPASESSTQATHSQTPPITNTSQTLKLLNDNMKTNSNQQNVSSVSNLTPHTLNINSSSSNSTTNTNTPSLIISTTKSNLIQHSDKPKISTSSPLISKETSFVSKPQPPPPPPPSSSSTSSATQLQQPTTTSIQTLNKELHSEQNIEIFSLQQTLQPPETLLKEQPKSQMETSSSTSSSTTSLPVQISSSINSNITSSQQSFKQFLQANATANQNQATITTKITKYVQDVKKAAAEQHQLLQQQQQQQHMQQQQHHQQQQNQQQQLSVNRTFSTTSTISSVSGLNKDKISGNVILNTHGNQQNVNTSLSSSTTNTSMNMNLNVNQSQTHQQFVGNMQQNKSFTATLEGNQADSNNQTKVGESQSIATSITQQTIQKQQLQQQLQQQQQQQQQQQHTPQSQNQILMQHIQQQQQQQQQHQHDPSKQIIKMEVDDTQPPPQFQQIQQVQLQQQQQQQHHSQQQQSFRTSSTPTSSLHNTLTSPMSTTPTNSVASTPTNEQTPHINLNNKQQLQQQQLHIQQHMQTNQQQHQQQQFVHTTQNIANTAGAGTVLNIGPTSTGNTTLSSPSLTAPNSASKDVDRKKRKREQQKPRKQQVIGNTKDTAATSSPAMTASTSNAANAKKRSRKSLKLEEDYDSYIDNLLSHMRQMQPLQVLEPQLNVNYGVCNIYGWRNFSNNSNSTTNSNSTSPVKESRQNERSHMFERELEGEFGAAHLPNKVPFYDFKSFMDEKTKDDSSTSSIQNNYYDQEFTSFTYKTEPEKLSSWVKVYRERAIDTPEIVSNKLLMPVDPVKTMRLNMLQQETFPGLILMSSTQQKLGRMSPVIPFVSSMALITKRKKTPLKPLENDAAGNGLYTKDLQAQDDLLDNKIGIKNSLNNQNVILSLPTSSAERLLDVLKNLANLLQLPSPIPYKIVDNNGDMDSESEQKLETTSNQETVDKETIMKQLSLQNILNGKYKMCRQCGKAITGRCIKNTEDFTKTKFHSKFVHPIKPRYFCNKVCYIQFRWSIEKKPSLSELKSVLESKSADTSFEAAVEAATKEGDLDLLTDEKESLKALLGTIQPTDANTTATTSAANNTTVATLVPKEENPVETVVKPKKIPFRYFSAKSFQNTTPVKRMSEKEIRDLLFKMDITMSVTMTQSNVGEPGTHQPTIEDRRQCVLCSQMGDGVPDGPSRLLNFDVDKWVHLNCALWSSEVYETISGGLVNFHLALQNGLNQSCNSCQQLGATVKCYKTRCGAVFHLPCALRDDCVFYQNKTIHCQAHAQRSDKDNQLMSLSVPRRVFVERDENRQVAAIMHHSEMKNLMRVGSLIFLNVGQLLPHQLEAFHTPNYIYPIGYKIIRFYWSMHRPNKRCRYICSIAEVAGRPEFRIVVQEPSKSDIELRDTTPKAVWQRVLKPVAEMRKTYNLVKLYPEFISGEDLFGLTEPSIVRIIESLPGVETLTNYRFKYGRNPLLDLPLALNPSGAARTEPKLRQLMGWKKHHPQRTCSNLNSSGGHQNNMTSVSAAGEVSCPYSKQFVHSKSSQYKKMKQEWRNNVYLARSKIQGLGLYAARDMERHTMIIEYIGEVIRSEVSEIREKQYEARNRGIYMFRLDEDRVVDATLSGGLARYINHSCNPNCVTEIVEVDRELRIIIFAKRRINRGEELSYDYKFDLEEEGSKIPCMCGAPNCRKWMN